jgi:YesN/AraC family two-component response regulator
MSEFVISFDISEYKRPNPNKRYFDIQEIGAVLSAYSNTGFWIGKDEYHNISLFKKIFWELERKQTGYMFNVQSLCTQIIVNAARSCMTKKESANIMPTKMKDDKRRFLLDFYFGECYKYLTFRKLAANLNVSERQLNRIIRKLYNTTFNEKLTSIKVQNAIHLLQTTNMTAEEISEQVGFANPSYFFRVFKKHCNMPPMEYKLQKILALNKGSAVD